MCVSVFLLFSQQACYKLRFFFKVVSLENNSNDLRSHSSRQFDATWLLSLWCDAKKKLLRVVAKVLTHIDLTYHLVPRAIWPHYVKWNFSTFCGLSRSTTYLYLPQRRIGPLDARSYPQGGVQINPMANLLHKMWKHIFSVLSQVTIFFCK